MGYQTCAYTEIRRQENQGPRKNRGPLKRTPLERSRIGRVERVTRSSGTGNDSFRLRFAPVELAHDIGANAPERLLVGLRFSCLCRFPRSYVVLMRLPSTSTCAPFLDRRRDVFGEPRAEHTDAMPFGLRPIRRRCSSTTRAWRRKER